MMNHKQRTRSERRRVKREDDDNGSGEETENPSQPNKTNSFTADKVGAPRTTDQLKASEEIPGYAASKH
jgi:hypothetical protein